ncbi:unnamed protein product [Miscanthus lutarioriparius]|uniref:beta-ketoacyl-[acyl-carrier-protein] synthase I n=1 Tax=Miscanthus lutarioriparius TaxID=422564 RepID=A0A811PW57_9POAL|nr:unnamed protein product [Miscanthus lutarioriparius]
MAASHAEAEAALLLRRALAHATSAPRRAPRRESDPKKRVVITGMGVVSVFGNDVGAYYDRLLAGSGGAGPIDRFDASGFSTRFAAQIRGFSCEGHIDDESNRRLDDCQRYALVAVRKALASAGLALGSRAMYKRPADRQGTRRRGRGLRQRRCDDILGRGGRLREEGAEGSLPLHHPVRDAQRGVGAGLHRRRDRLPWPQLLRLHSTADQIRLGRSDVMGGAEAAVAPVCLGGFAALRALSWRNGDPGAASRPWDRDRDGFVLGEGTGMCAPPPRSRGNVCVRLCSPLLFVVRCVRLVPRCKLMTRHGRRRGAPILAEYLGGAASCDAHHLMDPRPDGRGAAACIRRSLEDAGVAPEEVNYVNAHATSSLAGDLAEVKALKQVFKNPSQIKMNATKSMIGHCLGAAGGLEAIASHNHRLGASDHKPIRISNSFGFGGHNSVAVFALFKPIPW